MNRYKGRVETSKHGFIPQILDHESEDWGAFVLDNAYVEYGTGCWIDTLSEGEMADEAQISVYEAFKGDIPSGHYVTNVCSDYRVCYNPNCLEVLEIHDEAVR